MPESKDPRSGCGEGCQEQNSVLQPKHDGGFSAGLGKFIQMFNPGRRLNDHTAQRQTGQE